MGESMDAQLIQRLDVIIHLLQLLVYALGFLVGFTVGIVLYFGAKH